MNRGIILLEGSDGTGKTTLAKHIVEKFDGHYMHLTYRYPNNMFEYHAAALHRAAKIAHHRVVVLDRQWVSESVYAEVYRGGSRWPHMGRLFDRVMLKHAGVYVFCLAADLAKYEADYNQLKTSRYEMYDNTTKVADLYNRLWYGDPAYPGDGYAADFAKKFGGFREHYASFGYRKEYEGKDLNVFSEMVVDFLQQNRKFQNHRALVPCDYNWLGHSMSASYVMIGDRINKTNRVIDYPFYANVNSSLFLNRCFSQLGWMEQDFCWTNVNDPNGMTHALEAINRYHLRPIALGREAQKLLSLPDSHTVSHPSYARRFLNQDEYVEQLREVRNAVS